MLLWLYRFVGYDEAYSTLKLLRRELIAHPLNGLIVLLLSTRLLYSIPLLVDDGSNGFYFDCIRNTVFHREHGERDRAFAFLPFLNELLAVPPRRQNQMSERMADLLNTYTR